MQPLLLSATLLAAGRCSAVGSGVGRTGDRIAWRGVGGNRVTAGLLCRRREGNALSVRQALRARPGGGGKDRGCLQAAAAAIVGSRSSRSRRFLSTSQNPFQVGRRSTSREDIGGCGSTPYRRAGLFSGSAAQSLGG